MKHFQFPKTGDLKCPECGGKMTMLFTSAICDYCNPPVGSNDEEIPDPKATPKIRYGIMGDPEDEDVPF